MAEKYEIPEEGASMTTEYSSKKRRNANVPGSGVYRHPESGQEAIVQSDPLWGNTMAQGFARLGFKFVREAKAGEIKTLPEIAAEARSAEADTLKGITARLNEMDTKVSTTLEENKSLTAEVEELRAKLAEAEAEKAAAVKAAKAESKTAKADDERIKKAGAANTTDAATESANKAKANAEAAQSSRQAATGSTNTNVSERNGN